MIMKHTRLPVKGHRATLIISVALASLTLVLHQPLMGWVILMMMCSAVIRIYLFRVGQTQRLSNRLINLLAVLACIALAWFSTQQGLLEIMVNLLVTGCALKLLMLSKSRDFLQLSACAFFLIGCALIFEQALSVALILSIVLFLLLLSLQQLYAPQMAFKKQMSSIVKLGLQALPIAFLLFIVTPQLPPLWGMPAGKSTQTGLSEKMTPGDIAKLTQSTERVFTATFDDSLPAATDRYWRAMVLEEFDGRTWQVSDYRKQQQMLSRYGMATTIPIPAGEASAYQLLVEPMGNQWLYALNVALPADRSTRDKTGINSDYSLFARQPIMSKQAFDLLSFQNTPRALAASGIDTRLNLQRPLKNHNGRTQEWANRLRQQYSNNSDFADAVMAYFANQGFSYTLTPDAMRADPVDTFLFDKQAGFCAHYASAMAYVLRLAGIPARIVSGYHGGEVIADNVVSVFQYDAHAWVEASLDGNIWTRFDPTSMVAMSRLQYGFQQSMSSQQTDLPLFSRARAGNSALLGGLYSMMDTVNYQWSRWVLGFDAERQNDMFTNMLGEKTTTRLALFGLAIMLFIAGLLALYFIPKPRPKHADETRRLFDSLALQLHKITGVERATLSARQYLHAVKPHIDKETYALLAHFIETFEHIRYLPEAPGRPAYNDLRHQHRFLLKRLTSRSRGPSQGLVTDE